MRRKQWLLALLLLVNCVCAWAQGPLININVHFDRLIGHASWLLIIRDVDHNQVMPYIFDIKPDSNLWLIDTKNSNYLITVSTLQMPVYQPTLNTYKNYEFHNFCQLESRGHIIRGVSMDITISGRLTTNRNSIRCRITRYPN